MATKNNRVNHPEHYQGENGIETIEIIRHYTCDIANALKYLMRAGRKSEMGMEDAEKEIEDLKKALWYIEDYRVKIPQLLLSHFKSRERMEQIIIEVTGHRKDEIAFSGSDNLIGIAIGCLLGIGIIRRGEVRVSEYWEHDIRDAVDAIKGRILNIEHQLLDKELESTAKAMNAFMTGQPIEAIDGEDYVSKPGCVRETEPEKYDPLNMIVAFGRVYSLTDEMRKKSTGGVYSPCQICALTEFCVSQDGTESLKNLCNIHQAQTNEYYREVGIAKYSPRFGTVEVVDEHKEMQLELRELERAEEDEYSSAERERSRVKGQLKRLEEEDDNI